MWSSIHLHQQYGREKIFTTDCTLQVMACTGERLHLLPVKSPICDLRRTLRIYGTQSTEEKSSSLRNRIRVIHYRSVVAKSKDLQGKAPKGEKPLLSYLSLLLYFMSHSWSASHSSSLKRKCDSRWLLLLYLHYSESAGDGPWRYKSNWHFFMSPNLVKSVLSIKLVGFPSKKILFDFILF